MKFYCIYLPYPPWLAHDLPTVFILSRQKGSNRKELLSSMSDCFTLLNLSSFLNRVFYNLGNLRCSAFATATFTPNPSQTYLSVSPSLNITQHLPHLCPCSGYCQKWCCSSFLFKAKPLHLWLIWSTWSLKPPSLKPTITLPWCPVTLLVNVIVWVHIVFSLMLWHQWFFSDPAS